MRAEIEWQLHARQRAQCGVRRQKCLALESQAIHAAVELEPYLEANAGRRVPQKLHLFSAVHHDFQLGSGRGRELFTIQHTLEQQDGRLDARLTQVQCLPQASDRQGIRGLQSARDRDEAVSVGVGLDDRHHAGRGREAADGF